MKYLFLFVSVTNGFIPSPHLRCSFPLDVKHKHTKQELQLYEEQEKKIYLPKTLNQQTYVDYM